MKYDSTHGKFKHEVTADGDTLTVNGNKIKCIAASLRDWRGCLGEQWVWIM